jgi:hypothetical protein
VRGRDPNSYVDYENVAAAAKSARECRVVARRRAAYRLLDEVVGKAMDKTKVLLLVACLALAGVIAWEHRSDLAMLAPAATPGPLQVTRPTSAPSAYASAAAPAVPSTSAVPATTEPTTSAPAATPEKVAPKKTTPAKVTPRRDVVAEKPAVATPSRNNVATPSAPARVAEPVATPAVETARAEGVKTFTVIHDHSKGNFEKDPKASCVGELVISPTEIKFDGAGVGDSHHFEATWAEVLEAGSNKFFGSGIGGYHVTIKPDGKYQNINFAPKSKDKAEAKAILDLVNGNAKRADRGK